MKKTGRPAIYTREIADRVLDLLVEGEDGEPMSLRAICRRDDMPSRTTVVKWIADDTDGFAARYARTRDVAIDDIADQIIEIADTPQTGTTETDKMTAKGDEYTEVRRGDMTEHRKLRVDSRKWYVSKLAPKRYGERLQQEITGADGGPIKVIDESTAAARIASLLNAAKQRRDDSDLA